MLSLARRQPDEVAHDLHVDVTPIGRMPVQVSPVHDAPAKATAVVDVVPATTYVPAISVTLHTEYDVVVPMNEKTEHTDVPGGRGGGGEGGNGGGGLGGGAEHGSLL